MVGRIGELSLEPGESSVWGRKAPGAAMGGGTQPLTHHNLTGRKQGINTPIDQLTCYEEYKAWIRQLLLTREGHTPTLATLSPLAI